jgi:hypothetical protein
MAATGFSRIGHTAVDDLAGLLRLVGLMRTAARHARETLCFLGGHDMVLHFEPARLSLKCLSCGAETRGWDLDVRPAMPSRNLRLVHRRPVSHDHVTPPATTSGPDESRRVGPAPRAA